MIAPDFLDIEKVILSRGYKIFTNGPHDMNVGGIRTADMQENTFNDYIYIMWYDTEWTGIIVPGTTDPGTYYRNAPLNPNGTLVLLPGQYRGAYHIGKHRGKYECLKQRKEMDYWRVPKDFSEDWGFLYEWMIERPDYIPPFPPEVYNIRETHEIIGSNLHRASATRTSTQVDKWSAGCQVVASPHHFDAIMALARGQVALGGGSTFSYTLLLEDWF